MSLSPQLDASVSALASARSLIGDVARRIVNLLLTLLGSRLVAADLHLKVGVGLPLALRLFKRGFLLSSLDDAVVVKLHGGEGGEEQQYDASTNHGCFAERRLNPEACRETEEGDHSTSPSSRIFSGLAWLSTDAARLLICW